MTPQSKIKERLLKVLDKLLEMEGEVVKETVKFTKRNIDNFPTYSPGDSQIVPLAIYRLATLKLLAVDSEYIQEIKDILTDIDEEIQICLSITPNRFK